MVGGWDYIGSPYCSTLCPSGGGPMAINKSYALANMPTSSFLPLYYYSNFFMAYGNDNNIICVIMSVPFD